MALTFQQRKDGQQNCPGDLTEKPLIAHKKRLQQPQFRKTES